MNIPSQEKNRIQNFVHIGKFFPIAWTAANKAKRKISIHIDAYRI